MSGLDFAAIAAQMRAMINRKQFLAGAMCSALVAAAGPAFAQSAADARDLRRISNYLNANETLAGDFVQVGPDGEVNQGRFFMRRPGRVRFEYDPPNPTLVVSDGFWVGVTDTSLKTVDRYPLSDTPLHLLLKEDVDLAREGAVKKIERAANQMRITAINPDDPSQGSITLVFTDNPLELRQWIVVDQQGLTTTVALREMRSNISLKPDLFVIEDPS